MLYAVLMYSGGQTAKHGVRFNLHIVVYTFSVRAPNFIRRFAQVKGKTVPLQVLRLAGV